MKLYCKGLIQILLTVRLLHPLSLFILEVDHISQGSIRETEPGENKIFSAGIASEIEGTGEAGRKSAIREAVRKDGLGFL